MFWIVLVVKLVAVYFCLCWILNRGDFPPYTDDD